MEHHILFLAAQFENIVDFYFVRTLILVDTVFLLKFDMCKINILGRAKVVDGEEGNSERCLKWGGEGFLMNLSKNILK